MLVDLQKIVRSDDNYSFAADVAIIGAGAAGITLARRLLPAGARILLIESGDADHRKNRQDLCQGDSSGLDYYALRDSRLRFFGGTTAIWGGRCARLDAIDFTRRDWLDHSGWPLSLADLDSWYAEAQQALGLPVVAANRMPGFTDPLDGGELKSAFWQFDDEFSRFTLPACGDLSQASGVTILLNATLVGMQTSDDGRSVTRVTVSTPGGARRTITAGHFVLASGGLENPRLMLASKTTAHPQGIGNHYDQVGRYFMEHPHARGAKITTPDPARLFQTFPSFLRDSRNQRYGLLLRPEESTQARHSILNGCFTLGVFRHAGEKPALHKQTYNQLKHDMAPGNFGRALWRLVKKGSRWRKENRSPASRTRLLGNPKYGIYAVMRAEQAPNPQSRVTLSDQRDALGMPRIHLHWQMQEIDKLTVRVTMQALDRDLRRTGLGTATPSPWVTNPDIPWEFDHLVTSHPYGGYHHMGTTRMGTDPRTSVVDADCRVHGLDNLYVAGSSVFPTGGWANPTLTIIALSMRLGDHLGRCLAGHSA
ncbi:MAG: FAD-dependent oxidoreductase [Chromatocurvus sp.]